jgi:hypothetical protein
MLLISLDPCIIQSLTARRCRFNLKHRPCHRVECLLTVEFPIACHVPRSKQIIPFWTGYYKKTSFSSVSYAHIVESNPTDMAIVYTTMKKCGRCRFNLKHRPCHRVECLLTISGFGIDVYIVRSFLNKCDFSGQRTNTMRNISNQKNTRNQYAVKMYMTKLADVK